MVQKMMEEGAPSEGIEIAIKIARIFVLIGSLVAPIIWLLAISAILTLAARLFAINDAIKFKHIFAAIVHTSLISILIVLVNTALLVVFRDVEDIRRTTDMKIIPGLHLLFGSSEIRQIANVSELLQSLELMVCRGTSNRHPRFRWYR